MHAHIVGRSMYSKGCIVQASDLSRRASPHQDHEPEADLGVGGGLVGNQPGLFKLLLSLRIVQNMPNPKTTILRSNRCVLGTVCNVVVC